MNFSSLTLTGGLDDKPTFKLPYQSIGLKVTRLKPALERRTRAVQRSHVRTNGEENVEDNTYRSQSSSCVITPNSDDDSASFRKLLHKRIGGSKHHRNVSYLQTAN